eukprot:COSAG01_NODE_19949_length_980_cov_1.256527_2_plen_48_part_01
MQCALRMRPNDEGPVSTVLHEPLECCPHIFVRNVHGEVRLLARVTLLL